MDTIHICFYVNSFHGGGAERELILLANEFYSRGHKVDFVVSRKKGPLIDLLEAPIKVIGLNTKSVLFEPFLFSKYLLKHKPGYVISSMPIPNISSALAKVFTRKSFNLSWRVVSNLSKALEDNKKSKVLKYTGFFYRTLAPYTNSIVCVSEGVFTDLRDMHGLNSANLKVIYNPAFHEQIIVESKEGDLDTVFESALGESYLFIGIGRLIHAKGFDLLIDAFSSVVQSECKSRLFIVGDGPLISDLKARVRELNLEDHIHFLGFQMNPYKYLARADTLVLSSRYEGFGNVIVEALALDVKVVAADCESGPSEILKGGMYGNLVEVENRSELAEAMINSIEQPNPSYRSYAKEFSVSKVVDSYEALFFSNREYEAS